MMRVIVILVMIVLLPLLSYSQETEERVAQIIEKSYDLAYSGLFDESKIELVDALYNEEFKDFEPPIRFALGQICYEQELIEGAKYQWGIIVDEFPKSEEAHIIKNLYNVLDWVADKLIVDQVFLEQYNLSKLFWHPTTPDLKMDISELYDPIMALKYLEKLEKRFEQGSKKALILYDIFLLLMGYNNDNFGFHNVSDLYMRSKADPPSLGAKYHKEILENNYEMLKNKGSKKEMVQHYFLSKAKAISEQLKKIEGKIHYYIKTQFLLAVSTSGTKFLSRKIDLKEESIPYLRNVVNATEGDEANSYRLFALKWLSELEGQTREDKK